MTSDSSSPKASTEKSATPEAVSVPHPDPSGTSPTDGSASDQASQQDDSSPLGHGTSDAPPPKEPAWSPEAWGQAARATCLSALIGMALVVFARLGLGGDWVTDFLMKNKIGMPERMAIIYQMIAGGVLFGLVPLAATLFSKVPRFNSATFEQWAWFVSPLMLLPAIPVTLHHEVWRGRHEDLLPIVLFGALIAELLFKKASENTPEVVSAQLRRFLSNDVVTPETSRLELFLRQHSTLIFVCIIALAYGAFMSFYTVRWHHKLGTATFDLGINNNLIYGGLEGRFNQSTVIFPEDPQKYIANHVKIGLYTFLPVYALYPKPETLLIIQSVSMGLGAIPLFLFARRRIPETWAAALAAAYLSYYPLHGANFYEMKLPPTAAALVLASIWAIDSKRFLVGGIFFVWALIMREDMPVPLAVVGAVFLLSGHRPRAGLVMAALATVWFVVLRFRVMNEVGSWWFPNMYEDLWAAPEEGFRSVIKTLLSNPTFTLKHIFVEKKFWYLMHLLIPLMFLPARRWWGWAAFVPGAILTLLVTDYAPPTMFSFQYVMHWAPYLFVIAALVLASMQEADKSPHRARGAVVAMCLASLALTYNYGAFTTRDKALESGYHKIEFSFPKKERERYEDVKRLVASIPQSASVASTERIGAHLSSRVGFYTLRRGSHGADYIVARKSALSLDRTKDSVRKALTSGEYGLVGRYGEFAVFKKGASSGGNEAILDEWRLRTPTRTKKRANKEDRPIQRKQSPSPESTATVADEDEDE